jgi:hypothetical protein
MVHKDGKSGVQTEQIEPLISESSFIGFGLDTDQAVSYGMTDRSVINRTGTEP